MTTRSRFLSGTLVCIALPVCLALIALILGCARLHSPSAVTHLPSASAPSFNGEPSRARALLPAPGEELWILARGESPVAPMDEAPGPGALIAHIDEREIPMPLKHTSVRAAVSGYVGTVEVTQQFRNPYSRKIEAVYVFPLPHNAAVNEFIMTIGERRIRGIIRESHEAERLYQQAKQQGYVTSLLSEDRPNVFTQRVANIEPGKEIDVEIKYFHTLDYADGWYEFVFPMVVGPRFNPPGLTNGIGAVARRQTGASGQTTEIPYLRPGERTAHDISLSVDVNAGVPIEEFACNTHQVTSEKSSPEHLTVSLVPTDNLPNRDFVLRWRVAGDRIKSNLVTYRDERGGFFALAIYPPEELRMLERQPLELVFVLDCSGSMAGRPIEQAKAAVQRGLHLLQPGDSFQLVTFSVSTSSLGDRPLKATPENVRHALQYLRALEGEGGTMMLEGVKAALDFPHDPHRLRFVCFLTDGFIGNETEILAAIHSRLGASRIFSFGIGSSVNRYLLDHMAQLGHGAVAYLGLHDSAAQIMEDFFNRISHPALTDLAIDWGGLYVTEVFPSTTPDLFVGRPVIVAGRFAGGEDSTIHLNGMAAGRPFQMEVGGSDRADAKQTWLPGVWARMKIAELANRSSYDPDPQLGEQVKHAALDYNLMSPFTSFIAVDSTRRTRGSEGTTVPVAVPVPEGVKYKTTVDEH